MLSFSFFWAQDFCKKSVLARRFFFRVSVFCFVTITRHTLFYESIMVTYFISYAQHSARGIVTNQRKIEGVLSEYSIIGLFDYQIIVNNIDDDDDDDEIYYCKCL